MCDCYSHKCNHPGCNVRIPIHLEDYETGRDEIKVFCGSHIPKNRDDGVLWTWKQGKSKTRVFIKALTDNAKNHWEGNSINDEGNYIEIFGKKKV